MLIVWTFGVSLHAQFSIFPSSQWLGWSGTGDPTQAEMSDPSSWDPNVVNNGLTGSWEPGWHANQFDVPGPLQATDYVWTSTDPQFLEAWVMTSFDAGCLGNCDEFIWRSYADNCHTVYLNGIEVGSTSCDPASNNVTTELEIPLNGVTQSTNYITVHITNTVSTATINPRYLVGGLDVFNPPLCLDIEFNYFCTYTQLVGTKDDSQSPIKFTSYQWYFKGEPILGATGLIHNAEQGTGLYTLRGYYGNGCYKEKSVDVSQINEEFLPDVNVAMNCGTTITLEETTGLAMKSYLWNTGETTPSIDVDHGGTFTLRTINDNDCVTEQNFIVTDDCCEVEVTTPNGTEIIYDKRLFNTLYPDLKTISSVVDDGILYVLMQDDVAGPFVSGGPPNTFGFVLSLLDAETGAFLQAYDYQIDVNGSSNFPEVFWAQEIEIVSHGTSQENGIYIIGNTERIQAQGGQAMRQGREVIKTDFGAFIKLDLDSRGILEVKYTSIPVATREQDQVEGFNYESFSLIEEEGNKGWLIVGTAFDYTSDNVTQALSPILIKTDLLGNILDHKLVDIDLPCSTCPLQNENVWAIDISEQITGNDAEYAVLLQSENDNTTRTSYLLIDKDLNIYTRGNPIEWWTLTTSFPELFPSKIMYENFGTYQSVKIIGWYSSSSRSYIHEFDANATDNYIYNPNTSKEFLLSSGQGILDFTKQGASYYLASTRQIIVLDQALNVTGWSNSWDHVLMNPLSPRPYHFIHNLIHPCQNGGVLLVSRDYGYLKISSDLQMPCEVEVTPVTEGSSSLSFITTDHSERFTHFEVKNPTYSYENVNFDIECCSNSIHTIRSSTCDVILDFDLTTYCGEATLTDIDILGKIEPDPSFSWSSPTTSLSVSYDTDNNPTFHAADNDEFDICLTMEYRKDGSSCSLTKCKTINFVANSLSSKSLENGWENKFSNDADGMLGPWTISSSDQYYPIDIDGDGQEELLCTKSSSTTAGTVSLLEYTGIEWVDVGTTFSSTFKSYVNDGEFIIGNFDASTPGEEVICMGRKIGGLIFPDSRMYSVNNVNDINIWSEGSPWEIGGYFKRLYAGNFDGLNGDELLGFEHSTVGTATYLLSYSSGVWSAFFSTSSSSLWYDRYDIEIGDFSGSGVDQILTTSSNTALYYYNPSTSFIDVIWNSAAGPSPGLITSWSMPMAISNFMLIGDIDNSDSKAEILFIEGGSGATKASTADYHLLYTHWTDNWSTMVNEPYIDDWPLYDQAEAYTKYVLIRNDASSNKDDLLAIRELTCGSTEYLAKMYSTNNSSASYKKSPESGSATLVDYTDEAPKGLWIYPNPTHHSFAIGTSDDDRVFDHVKIISTTGQVILEDSYVAASRVYSLEGNESGIYIVEVSIDNSTKRMKLILNH